VPRQIRIEYEGALYHVMSRGDHREAIVQDEKDRAMWIHTLAGACTKCDWQVHAYCLMTNHFHLVMETPSANLVSGMKWLLGTYTVRFNRRHQLRGHLFAGRYKSLLIDESDPYYLRIACDYVHLNPARAGLIPRGVAIQPISGPLRIVQAGLGRTVCSANTGWNRTLEGRAWSSRGEWNPRERAPMMPARTIKY